MLKKPFFSAHDQHHTVQPDLFSTDGSGRGRFSIHVLLDFSLTVKAATLIFISGSGSAISSGKKGKSGFIYNLVKSK